MHPSVENVENVRALDLECSVLGERLSIKPFSQIRSVATTGGDLSCNVGMLDQSMHMEAEELLGHTIQVERCVGLLALWRLV